MRIEKSGYAEEFVVASTSAQRGRSAYRVRLLERECPAISKELSDFAPYAYFAAAIAGTDEAIANRVRNLIFPKT
jgi:hypothetical protein